jgi:hypothetical protein
MKMLRGRQRSFQMLTQFTMLNTVQGPLACNKNASLRRAAVLPPFTLKGVIMHKGNVAHPGKHCEMGSTPLKSKLDSQY